MHEHQENLLCKSYFKNGAPETCSEQLTQVWATLINQIEKSNGMLAGGR